MQWLMSIIRYRCKKAINARKLLLLSTRIKRDNIFDMSVEQLNSFNLYNELQRVINSLQYKIVHSECIIYISTTNFIRGTCIPLSRLSRFVCYGDLKTKGYPILSYVIDNVIANIAKYYNYYNNMFFGGV